MQVSQLLNLSPDQSNSCAHGALFFSTRKSNWLSFLGAPCQPKTLLPSSQARQLADELVVTENTDGWPRLYLWRSHLSLATLTELKFRRFFATYFGEHGGEGFRLLSCMATPAYRTTVAAPERAKGKPTALFFVEKNHDSFLHKK